MSNGQFTRVNKKFCAELWLFKSKKLIGQNIKILNSGIHPPAAFQDLWGYGCGRPQLARRTL